MSRHLRKRAKQNKVSSDKRSLVLSCMFFLATDATAFNFVPDASQSEWHASGDKFECKLVHPIPVFGEAVFSRRAGHVSTFNLNSFESPDVDSEVKVIAEVPNWKKHKAEISIATLNAAQSTTPLWFESPLTEQILAQLQAGRFTVFSDWHWYPNTEPVNVGLSSVNFRSAYREYQQCVTKLFHLSYDQLRVSEIVFDKGSDRLPDVFKGRLKDVAELILADPSIKHCHIAAFTDEGGSSRANIELSWRRSEAVEDYLVGLGVSADMITTSYYGEANRARSSGKANDGTQNRKVTVRIDRK